MRVAVTGSTGHVGANVVRDLLARGFSVRALCRKSSNLRALEGLDIDVATADVLQPESLENAFKNIDAVVNLAAIISIQGDPDGRVMRTNVEGPRNVARACLATGVKKLVHISSIHAFKSSPELERIDEESERADDTCFAYDRSKAKGEDEIRAAIADGLDATIVNPTGIIGPHDYTRSLSGDMLRNLFRGRLPALIDAGFDWVDVRDVASAVSQAIEKGRRGENYLISGNWVSTSDLAQHCAAVSGVRAPTLVLPWWTAIPGLPFLQAQSFLTGQRPLYTYESLVILRNSNKNCCSKKAQTELGFRARSVNETIVETYEWIRNHNFL